MGYKRLKQPGTPRWNFTLMEALVSLGVLGTVMAIVYASMHGWEQRARNSLQMMGLQQVEFTSVAPLSCGKDDFFRYHFTAVRSGTLEKQSVSGTVCCTVYGSCYARW